MKATPIEAYIDAAPMQAQSHLRELHALLRKVVPDATEAVKWNAAVYEEGRILFAFKPFRAHLNFMPTSSAMKPFKEELAKFKTGKGSIQIPYDAKVPKALLRKIAAHRAKELRELDVRWTGG